MRIIIVVILITKNASLFQANLDVGKRELYS